MNSVRAATSLSENREKERDFLKIFHSSREKNEEEGRGKRNSDHVPWQSISAATNGCSEKMN